MPSGARPGERRGGRGKGALNKKTLARIAAIERAGRLIGDESSTSIKDTTMGVAIAHALRTTEGDLLGREVLNLMMKIYLGRMYHFEPRPVPDKDNPQLLVETNPNADEVLFDRYGMRAVDAATKLAPYQSPQYRAVFVSPPSQQVSNGKRRYTLTVIDHSNGRAIATDIERDENVEQLLEKEE